VKTNNRVLLLSLVLLFILLIGSGIFALTYRGTRLQGPPADSEPGNSDHNDYVMDRIEEAVRRKLQEAKR
jgi:hypothetical protein